jgi:hypothetical protein
MARLNDAILQNAFSRGEMPMLDMQYGGMNGYAPNLVEWVSNQSYVRRNLICLLIEAPKGFQYLPDPQFWVSALRALVETHAKTIEGFNAGLTVEMSETAVGGGGEQQQDPTNVTIGRSEPTFGFVDKYGRPIQTFIQEWIRGLIMDPYSKVPDIATLEGERPSDLLSDMYSATMLFFEPDPTHTKVAKAWLCCNMYPSETGEISGKRDLTSAGELAELTIKFSAVTQTGLGVRAFAQKLLDNINFTNANPYVQNAFVQDISADVSAIANGNGYKSGAETLGETAIRR